MAGWQAGCSWYYHADRKPIMALPHVAPPPPLTVCVIIVLGMAMVLTDRCFWWWWWLGGGGVKAGIWILLISLWWLKICGRELLAMIIGYFVFCNPSFLLLPALITKFGHHALTSRVFDSVGQKTPPRYHNNSHARQSLSKTSHLGRQKTALVCLASCSS